MCGFVEAGIAVMALGTLMGIQQTNSLAKAEAAEVKRQGENAIVANELAKDDQRRQVASLQEEALAIYGANGVTARGTPSDHLSNLSNELGRTTFGMDFNSRNQTAALNASITNIGASAKAKNTSSLFSFASKALMAGGNIGGTPTQGSVPTSAQSASAGGWGSAPLGEFG